VSVEPGPKPHSRLRTVRTDDPTCTQFLRPSRDSFGVHSCDGNTPTKSHTALLGTRNHRLMEHGATDAQPRTFGEIRFHPLLCLQEANSGELTRAIGRNSHTETLKSFDRIWHQAFAARLIDQSEPL